MTIFAKACMDTLRNKWFWAFGLVVVGLVVLITVTTMRGCSAEKAVEQARVQSKEEAHERVREALLVDSLNRMARRADEVQDSLVAVAKSLGLSLEEIKLWQHAIKNRAPLPDAVAYRDSILRATGQR